GLEKEQVHIIEKYLLIEGTNEEKLSSLVTLLGNHEIGNEGINEIKYILYHSSFIKHHSSLMVDLTLARGLNYYTGTIFEIKAIGVQMGSIGGGGRYNDLTGLFGVPNIPG
ncbi:ATP phosphoribosyltransferase regulatory subunit, partial [Escherichia coli]|uniref:ATP phosphoribosyltransferase regulatory subunit n=1 Tax=Escherichia coli TaxID=562 RepID=UPI00159B97E2